MKNRPKLKIMLEQYSSEALENAQDEYIKALDSWFVGFERELREMRIVNAVMPTVDKKKYGAYCVIREVLGE